ncbi:MAG: hypothetical protein R3344_04200 [Acidobacteriota bacterium]|nr:hypothetical protein [Acidobacteriota bacterium]
MEERTPILVNALDLAALAITALIGRLPWRLATSLGAGAGRLAGLLVLRKKKVMVDNLERAGAPDPDGAYWSAWANTGRTVFEMLWATGRTPEQAIARTRMEGLESFDDALAGGRGVLLASGHLADWELGVLSVALAGHKVAVIARPLRFKRLERRLIDFRERGGIRTLVRGRGTALAAFRWLSRGGVLGCLMDRVSTSVDRIRVPFLGRGMNVPLGPAELACRAGSAVVFGVAIRCHNGMTGGGFRRLETSPGDGAEKIALLVGEALESAVRARPDQWYWIYRRQPGWDGTPVISYASTTGNRAPAAGK